MGDSDDDDEDDADDDLDDEGGDDDEADVDDEDEWEMPGYTLNTGKYVLFVVFNSFISLHWQQRRVSVYGKIFVFVFISCLF